MKQSIIAFIPVTLMFVIICHAVQAKSSPENSRQTSMLTTYTGVIPCADCPGIEETLTLNPDNTFNLKRIYQERSPEPFVATGHWIIEGSKLILTEKSGKQFYEIVGRHTLRHLDQSGNPIDTKANTELQRLGSPTMQLLDTRWQLIELEGQSVPTEPAIRREIQMTLFGQDAHVSGFSGCNRFFGQYELKEDQLRFSEIAGTRMACPPPAMELENKVLAMFASVTTYHLEGKFLFLLNGQALLAKFEQKDPITSGK